MNYEQLVAEFRELMERGEKDQWKLAELAYLASEAEHGGLKQFATDTGYAYDTIKRYKQAFLYRQDNEKMVSDHSFADVIVLAGMSGDRATAVQVLASAMGKPIGTVKSDTDAINIVQDFLTENPELVTAALKDDDTRSAVAAAAFKAATEDVVAGAEGITKEAAKNKVPTAPTTRGAKHAEIERLKLDVARAGRENGILTARWSRDFEYLKDALSADEMTFIYDQLGAMYDRIAELRVAVNEARENIKVMANG